MNCKLLGAILIFAACTGCGFYLAHEYRSTVKMMKELLRCLEWMYCELEYKLTPLPQLLDEVGNMSDGIIGNYFLKLSDALGQCNAATISECVDHVTENNNGIPGKVKRYLFEMGDTLGQFDLDGQLKSIDQLKLRISGEVDRLEQSQTERIKSYRTLGLCAGAALAIILM